MNRDKEVLITICIIWTCVWIVLVGVFLRKNKIDTLTKRSGCGIISIKEDKCTKY